MITLLNEKNTKHILLDF